MGNTNFPDGVKAAGVLVCEEVTFTETSGAGTYTGSVAVPAGAYIVDIVLHAVAVWTNAGTATMVVGDGSDDDGFFTAVNLKATDLTAGQSIDLDMPGGKQGAYITIGTYPDSHVSGRYSASARSITGKATTSSTGGGAGRTRMLVCYVQPTPTAITAATKA